MILNEVAEINAQVESNSLFVDAGNEALNSFLSSHKVAKALVQHGYTQEILNELMNALQDNDGLEEGKREFKKNLEKELARHITCHPREDGAHRAEDAAHYHGAGAGAGAPPGTEGVYVAALLEQRSNVGDPYRRIQTQ
jgi:hypothetical protein